MRRAYIAGVGLTVALSAGCGQDPGDPSAPDAGGADASSEIDADVPLTSGLLLMFDVEPDIPPGNAGGLWNVEIDQVEIRLRDIRVLGDSGDLEQSSKDLRWEGVSIEEVGFADAQPGRYQTVLATVIEFDIDGSLELDGSEEDCEIDLEDDFDISIDLGSVEVTAGDLSEVTIVVHLSDLVNIPDWSTVDEEDGVLVVESPDDQAPELVSAIQSVVFDALN